MQRLNFFLQIRFRTFEHFAMPWIKAVSKLLGYAGKRQTEACDLTCRCHLVPRQARFSGLFELASRFRFLLPLNGFAFPSPGHISIIVLLSARLLASLKSL
jgi:hypothetical protein